MKNNPEKNDWTSVLRQNFTHWEKLADFLELSPVQRERIAKNRPFVLNLPFRLASKIQKSTLDDPILLQFLPLKEEEITDPLFVKDPVGDFHFRKAPKLLHKYAGRALLVTTSACAMHCRYCFRQNFDYEVRQKGFAAELEMIGNDPSLKEIILSGGDPLSLPNKTLGQLLGDLEKIPHVQRVRFHSRFPVGIPERIEPDFLHLLQQHRFSYWFVVHINHARELDQEVVQALQSLLKIGIPVLNQAVFLHGVNDSLEAQKELCEALINACIQPYYLHQLDSVEGAKHFAIEESRALRIVEQLAKVLPGYGVPKYVKEVCGEPNKTRIL